MSESRPPPDVPDDEALAALLARVFEGTPEADEAGALAEVTSDLEALDAGVPEAIRPDVRAAALAAWSVLPAGEADALAVTPRSEATPRVLRPARPPAPHVLRWAALLLAGLGITLFAVLSGSPEASAGLRLATWFRLDQAEGRPETTSGREFPWGGRITAEPNEVLGFQLSEGSAVVLRGEGALRLDRTETGSVLLRLEAGAAQLAVAPGSVLHLAVGSSRLDFLEGRARVTVGPGSGWALALGPTGRGRLRMPGAEDRPLRGPRSWTGGGPGGLSEEAEAPGPEVFRLPSALGAAHLGRAPGRRVATRQWRVAGGRARRLGTSLVPGSEEVRLAWRPSPDVRRAHTLRLAFEGDGGLEVALAGVDAAPVLADRSVDLPLPPDWYARAAADGSELVLVLRRTRPDGGDVRFRGATFLSNEETKTATTGDRSSQRE